MRRLGQLIRPIWRSLAVSVLVPALLAPSLPWLWRAWFSSPLDALGWVFLVLAFLWWFLVLDLAFVPEPVAGDERPALLRDHAGVPVLLGFVALGLMGLILDVRVALAAAALGAGWAIAWLLLGGRLAMLLTPALVLGLLSLPTVGFLLQRAWVAVGGWLPAGAGGPVATGGAGVLLLKACIALLALLGGLGLAWLARRGRLPAPSVAGTAYGSALSVALLALALALSPPVFGPALALVEEQWAFGDWLGAEIPVSPAEQRLFGAGRKLSKRLYSNRDGRQVGVLLVESDDVHDLHTPEYCLSGSGWRLYRDGPLSADEGLSFGARTPAAGALAAVRGDQRLAGVYWFASNSGTTDDLAGLRLQRRAATAGPVSMTLITSIGEGLQAPDRVLADFVRDAPWAVPTP